MRIVNLVENTEGVLGCGTAHGLSFYIETPKHRLLMDAGPSDLLVKNAAVLGVDLRTVDTLVLSHGHYDHADGIPAFARLNPSARIYLRSNAAGDYCSGSAEDGTLHYVGIDPSIPGLPQLVPVDGDLVIDEELSLFTNISEHPYPYRTGSPLSVRENGACRPDSFRHEQCLVIRAQGKTVLLSGCAHNGILNILEHFRKLYGSVPDAVISGFHMMPAGEELTAEEEAFIRSAGRELRSWPCEFYTCHCTSLPAYHILKEIPGLRLHYIHCGETIEL